jgi:hypothetical protein
MSRDTVEQTRVIHGYILGQSDRAIKVELHAIGNLAVTNEDGEPQTEWFPLSQITKIHRTAIANEKDFLEVKEWILKQKELI